MGNGTNFACSDTPDDALSMLRHEPFDLVVLDLVSMRESGFGFLRNLRAAHNETPVVVITGLLAGDCVRALSLGADDAVTQPVELEELQARIQAVFRRHRGYSQAELKIGELSIFMTTREARFRDVQIRLTGKEYATLELLALRRGQVVTKEMLLSQLYGGMDEPEVKIIDVFICKLRKKLIAAGCLGPISTVWGRGYALSAVATASVAAWNKDHMDTVVTNMRAPVIDSPVKQLCFQETEGQLPKYSVC
jgi:two-component system cell cycle response regulator CtrA